MMLALAASMPDWVMDPVCATTSMVASVGGFAHTAVADRQAMAPSHVLDF